MIALRASSSTRHASLNLECLEERAVPAAPVVTPVGTPQSAITDLIHSRDGRHVAYVADNGGSFQVYKDGQAIGGTFESVDDLQFTPDSKHVVFKGDSGSSEAVYEDYDPIGPYGV